MIHERKILTNVASLKLKIAALPKKKKGCFKKQSREMIWDGRWEGGSGLGTHVHPWLIHVNVWQNQYNIVKQSKVKIKIFKKWEDKRQTGRKYL